MTEYNATGSCWFASVGNVYKVYYHRSYLLIMIVIGYIRQITWLYYKNNPSKWVVTW